MPQTDNSNYEKNIINSTAKFYDVKLIIRKALQIPPSVFYVKRIRWGNDFGFLVVWDLDSYIHLTPEVFKSEFKGCVKLSQTSVFIQTFPGGNHAS